jgi:excisionase family DNA binding protein
MATAVLQRHLLTVTEVAQRLRVSSKTIYRLIANQELPVFYVGASIRIDEAVLEDWLQGRHGGRENGD